ncbi:MAG: hypothetical protein NTX28_01570 [Novosphingobium sp.]|nr:hypothetical protein [Novosphingobium sp.]
MSSKRAIKAHGKAHGIADAIIFALTLPGRANVPQILIRPTTDTAPM